jgi:hypothetical protein
MSIVTSCKGVCSGTSSSSTSLSPTSSYASSCNQSGVDSMTGLSVSTLHATVVSIPSNEMASTSGVFLKLPHPQSKIVVDIDHVIKALGIPTCMRVINYKLIIIIHNLEGDRA